MNEWNPRLHLCYVGRKGGEVRVRSLIYEKTCLKNVHKDWNVHFAKKVTNNYLVCSQCDSLQLYFCHISCSQWRGRSMSELRRKQSQISTKYNAKCLLMDRSHGWFYCRAYHATKVVVVAHPNCACKQSGFQRDLSQLSGHKFKNEIENDRNLVQRFSDCCSKIPVYVRHFCL